MTVELIRTKADYKSVLSEIKKLWYSDLNTPVGDRLELYEKKYFPNTSSDPIKAIKLKMKQNGLIQVDVAKFFGGKIEHQKFYQERDN